MKAVKIRAARTGRGDSQVIEESLRRDLGLDLLEHVVGAQQPFQSVTLRRSPSRHSTRRDVVVADGCGRSSTPTWSSPARSRHRAPRPVSCDRSLGASLSSSLRKRCWTSSGERLPIPSCGDISARQTQLGLVRWVADSATVVVDPGADPPVHSADPDDDYLIVLASAHRAALVSGDKHLLTLEGEIPVFSPRAFIDLLAGA